MGRRRLLVVDDNTSVCEFVQDRLEALGYSVLVAHDGRTALAMIALEAKHAPIEGILLDLHMPVMDGMDVLRELQVRHRHIPIVIMTADPDPRLREQALALGASQYVVKPLDSAQFERVCLETFPLTEKES